VTPLSKRGLDKGLLWPKWGSQFWLPPGFYPALSRAAKKGGCMQDCLPHPCLLSGIRERTRVLATGLCEVILISDHRQIRGDSDRCSPFPASRNWW